MATRPGIYSRIRGTFEEFRSLDKEAAIGIATVLPTLFIFVGVFALPVAYGLWASLHHIDTLSPVWQWAGYENYITVASTPEFYSALQKGVVFTLGSVLVQTVVGVVVALLLWKVSNRLLNAATIALYLAPTVIVALVFNFMLSERHGVIMSLATDFGLANEMFDVWADGSMAMALVILIGSYKFAMFITIMVFARLGSIPSSYYEAATMAGANTFQQFKDITWPQIRNIVALTVLLRIIFMFNKFDIIWILTQGGPGSETTTLPIYAYQLVYESFSYGLGVTTAVFMFVILATGGIIYLAKFNPEEGVRGDQA